MRSETEVSEHLEWLKVHCQRYTDEQRDVAITQLMTLLWVLGDEPTAAKEKAGAFWDASRDGRRRE